MKVVSCDGHLVEPLEALPAGARYEGLTKQLLVLPKGYLRMPLPVWTSVGAGTLGFRKEGDSPQPLGLDDRPEAYEAEARARRCEERGVGAEILYPTFAGLAVETATDDEYAVHAAETYNTWAGRTFHHPLFYPLYLLPVLSDEQCKMWVSAAEDDGYVGVLFPQQPLDKERRWRDFVGAFKVAAAAGLAVHWHAFTRPAPKSFSREPLTLAWEGIRAGQDILLELILGGVFREVPGLKVVLAEMDCGWVPHFKLRLQRLVDKYGKALGLEGVTPMDIARWFDENIYFAVQDVQEIFFQGQHVNGLWGWDYPHSDAVPVPAGEYERAMTRLNAKAVRLYPRLAGVLEKEGV